MRSSKKAIVSFLLVIIIVAAAFTAVFSFTEKNDYALSDELVERLSYSGSIDFLVVGASHAEYAFVPKIIDKKLDCFSYNLAQDAVLNEEKIMLLRNEMNRNPVKTVVLEMSYDTLTKNTRVKHTDAAMIFSNRLDNFGQRAENLIKYTTFNNYDYILSDSFIECMKAVATGRKTTSYADYSDSKKGGKLRRVQPVIPDGSKKPEDLRESEIIFTPELVKESHLDAFDKVIQLCKGKGCRVIVAVTPVSDYYIWSAYDLDAFNEWMKDYCKERAVEYYDFNLIKERYDLFNDDESYSIDSHHMSKKGAKKFTRLFCETAKKTGSGIDVSDEFYDNYSDIIKQSPYR